MRILQVNTNDGRGGAARITTQLHRSYHALGHEARMAVGQKTTDDPTVWELPNDEARAWVTRAGLQLSRRLKSATGETPGVRIPAGALRRISDAARSWDQLRGLEDFHYPATWRILDGPDPPEVLQLHNLHANYFDLRSLPWLTTQLPVVLTLHDAWLLSGHCAHSFDCNRWETGCGACPDLATYPAIRRDATHENWRRKQAIYAASTLHVATPCRWLMRRVERSMLWAGVKASRVIPNGVDLTVFRPGSQREARQRLGIPPDERMLLFVAEYGGRNYYKDFPTLTRALGGLAAGTAEAPERVVVLGHDLPPETVGSTTIQYVPYVEDVQRVADYYRAADIYVHPARVEVFSTAVIEAMACSLPVITTAVGGQGEIVCALDGFERSEAETAGPEATGILTRVGDAEQLAAALRLLVRRQDLAVQLGEAGAARARARFGAEGQARAYVEWFRELSGAGTEEARSR